MLKELLKEINKYDPYSLETYSFDNKKILKAIYSPEFDTYINSGVDLIDMQVFLLDAMEFTNITEDTKLIEKILIKPQFQSSRDTFIQELDEEERKEQELLERATQKMDRRNKLASLTIGEKVTEILTQRIGKRSITKEQKEDILKLKSIGSSNKYLNSILEERKDPILPLTMFIVGEFDRGYKVYLDSNCSEVPANGWYETLPSITIEGNDVTCSLTMPHSDQKIEIIDGIITYIKKIKSLNSYEPGVTYYDNNYIDVYTAGESSEDVDLLVAKEYCEKKIRWAIRSRQRKESGDK